MLRNQPDIRDQSIDEREIDRREHYAWFDRVLHDPNFIGYVAESESQLAGFGRALCKGTVFEVSVAVAERFRNLGIAKSLILSVIGDVPSGFSVIAKIRKDNVASNKLFRSIGFEPIGLSKGIMFLSLEL
jgi:ribosomal protein S18 acetylase RimI-like enzyme